MDDRKKPHTTSDDARALLLKAAKSLFAQKGFDGTTVKDLSESAGVNVSLVSYHFGGKEGLFHACLEEFGKERLAMAQRMLEPPHSLEEFKIRLRLYVEEMINTMMQESEVSQIVLREFEVEMSHAWSVFVNTFLKVFETLVTFFKTGQERGIIRADLDPQTAATVFFGSFMHICRSNRIAERIAGNSLSDPAYREKVVSHLITMCLEGCAK